jgi:signal transduction histidine kinase
MKDTSRLVLSVSVALTSVEAEDADAAIEQGLAESAALTGADRTYVFLLSETKTHLSNTHEWCAPGITPAKDDLQRLELGAFPIGFRAFHRGEDVVVPSVDATPAGPDREEWQREGIRSLFCTPLRVHDRIVGFLGCDWVRSEHSLDAQTQELIRLTSRLVATAVSRRGALARLAMKSGFDALVLRLSSEFINRRGEAIREAVHRAIIEIAEYAEFDGAYLFRFKDDGRAALEFIWHRAPLSIPDAGLFRQPDANRFRWWRDRMRDKGPIALASLDELPADPADVRQTLAAHGITAVVDLPIRIGGDVWGFVGFATGRGPRSFTADDVQLLELATQFLAAGIGRADADRAESDLSAQLVQSQKMEAVGLLAGGLAHDFNNLLLVITLSLHSARAGLATKDETQTTRALEEIQGATTRASTLTRQLLTLSRASTEEPTLLDARNSVDAAASMVRRLVTETIVLSVAPAPAPLRVRVDATELELCLLNLCLNARDAMPEGGTLSLSAERVELRSEEGLPPWVAPGPHVRIAVRDTGHGMDAETLRRVFDPFFTTKERDKGTGLGLSLVWNIVKRSSGFVRAWSTVDNGSTFAIHLPAVEESSLGHATLPAGQEAAQTPEG